MNSTYVCVFVVNSSLFRRPSISRTIPLPHPQSRQARVRLIVRGKNGAVVTKIWGPENLISGASLADLHTYNLRSVLCEFTTSGTEKTEVETLAYELQYNQPNDPDGAPIVIKNTLSLKFVEDESVASDIDPRVKTLYVTQTAADMDKKIHSWYHMATEQKRWSLLTNKSLS